MTDPLSFIPPLPLDAPPEVECLSGLTPKSKRAEVEAAIRACREALSNGSASPREAVERHAIEHLEALGHAGADLLVRSIFLEREEELDVPEFPESCWRPGFAEFREAYAAVSEACDAFWFGGYLVAAALMLGRQARLNLGVDVYANVYLAAIGQSGRARKSTAVTKAVGLVRGLDEGIRVTNGIGSPEGLIDLLRSETPGEEPEVLITVAEMARILTKGKQEGTSGLIPMLVEAYDCEPVELPNRKSKVRADKPYLCVATASTADWLTGNMTVTDARAGFANRFMYLVGRERAPIPRPPQPDGQALGAARKILTAARARHAVERHYAIEDEAAGLYDNWYHAERRREYASPILEVIAQRLHLYAWKVALIYAAIEGTEQVTEGQMAAALDFADYQREVQSSIFAGFGDDVDQQIRDRVVNLIDRRGPQGWRDIQSGVRKVSREQLRRATQQLLRLGVLEMQQDGRRQMYAISDD